MTSKSRTKKKSHPSDFGKGIKSYIQGLSKMERSYQAIIRHASRSQERCPRIEDPTLFQRAISLFGPQLNPVSSKIDLKELYDLGFHKKTGAVIVSSRGVNLFSRTFRFGSTYSIRYLTAAVYMPNLGVEVAQIGLVGDVYDRPFVLRSESACTPSFLFGSLSCNCAFQWRCTHELAGALNPRTIPPGEDFEKWLLNEFCFEYRKHIPKESGIGFLMIHLDNQNGMGCGYTPGVFSLDLSTRSILRQGGLLGLNQSLELSMQKSFESLGLPLDPRRAHSHVGYQISPILMDFLGVNPKPVLLSNNPQKIQMLESFGYLPQRLKALGETNSTGSREAKARSQELGHLDIGNEVSSYEQEFQRLKAQIITTFDSIIPTRK